MELLAEVLDVVVGHLGGVDVVLNGVVLCGQAEGVIADGEQDVVALHPLLPADDVHGGEGPGVAHVEPLAGGIGELDQAEELLPSLVPGDGGEGLLLQPLLLPLFLNAGKIVFHILLLIPVNGFLCSIYFCRGRPLLLLRGNSPSVRGKNTLTQPPWVASPVTDAAGEGTLLRSRWRLCRLTDAVCPLRARRCQSPLQAVKAPPTLRSGA